MLEHALSCIARGWYVFPCWPKTKQPMTRHGWKDASNSEDAVREWWRQRPDANVAIACNPSNLCVVDIDHGLANEDAFKEWRERVGISETYTIRTGRRPEFGVQMYFEGVIPDVGSWQHEGCEGQVKSLGGYVMAEGCVHPSGERYDALCCADPIPTVGVVRSFQSAHKRSLEDDGEPITRDRNVRLTSIAGKLRNAGLSSAALEVALLQVNEDRCDPPLDEDEVKRIAANVGRYANTEDPIAVLGASKPVPEVKNWRDLFHTKEQAFNAPPVSFLIEGFLQREGVTAIAAPVRERKSMIAINIVHALVTGAPLFGHFKVVKKPSRVLYLVPEVSLGPFTDRLKKIGLLDHVGETLFYRTLSADGSLSLSDASLDPALPGSVVFLDTAIRFLEGDENSSKDVRSFADSIFALLQKGAESVVMLHHSPKDSGDTMTLENAMRGSGDMGAFLASCWGTKLQDPTDPYKSTSFITNLKQRDFESKDFEATCDAECRMSIVGEPGEARLQVRRTFKGNKDGKDEAAIALIKSNRLLSAVKMSQLLKEHAITRSSEWVRQRRFELNKVNDTHCQIQT